MDMVVAFHHVVQLATAAQDPGASWATLRSYLMEFTGRSMKELAAVDLAEDVRNVRSQLEELLRSESPPQGLNAVWFGMFDRVDQGREHLGYYVAGIKNFDARDPDSRCRPAWWPEGRYLTSASLEAIKQAELAAAEAGNTEARQLLGYAGQLGAALLLSKFASEGLFKGLARVVGFDSGDFAVLEA